MVPDIPYIILNKTFDRIRFRTLLICWVWVYRGYTFHRICQRLCTKIMCLRGGFYFFFSSIPLDFVPRARAKSFINTRRNGFFSFYPLSRQFIFWYHISFINKDTGNRWRLAYTIKYIVLNLIFFFIKI